MIDQSILYSDLIRALELALSEKCANDQLPKLLEELKEHCEWEDIEDFKASLNET